MLFSFTTPAKFCFRAIATFCKHVVPEPHSKIAVSGSGFLFPSMPYVNTPPADDSSHANDTSSSPFLSRAKYDVGTQGRNIDVSESSSRKSSLKRRLSRAATSTRNGGSNGTVPPLPNRPISKESEDVAGPRFNQQRACPKGQREAGDPIIYSDTEVCEPFVVPSMS